MAGTGWSNALPMEIGGQTTHIENIYAALKGAVGVGGSSSDENGIEASWRAAKASVIAASLDSYERAVLQAIPEHASDHIPVYERILGISPGEDQNEEDRRLAVVAAWVSRILSTMPEIRRSLQTISSQLDIEELDYDEVVYTLFGKMFPAYGGEATLGTPQFPNFSSDFILRVTYTLGSTETSIPTVVRMAAARLLRAVLPAWVDWCLLQVSDPPIGLICDGASVGSVLDYTPMVA